MEASQVYFIIKAALASFLISAAHLKILSHFFFPEYELDWRRIFTISLKTFVPASVIAMASILWIDYLGSVWPGIIVASCIAIYLARRMLIQAGIDRPEAVRLLIPWFTAMLLLWIVFLILGGYLQV